MAPAILSISPMTATGSSFFSSTATNPRSKRMERKHGIPAGQQEEKKTITSYQKDRFEALKEPYDAANYLDATIEEGNREVSLRALRNVAEANGGMATIAAKSNLSREHLYRMLFRMGNPEIKSLFTILHYMGLRLAVEAGAHICNAAFLS